MTAKRDIYKGTPQRLGETLLPHAEIVNFISYPENLNTKIAPAQITKHKHILTDLGNSPMGS